jgi:hypothetical protein
MAGAAILLPHHAFAEKNVPSVKAIPQNAADQAHNTAAQKAKEMVVHQSAMKQTGKTTPSPVVKQISKTTTSLASSRKPAVVGKNAAAQVTEKGQSALVKTAKTVQPPGQAKAAVVKETNKSVSKNDVVKSAAPLIQHEMAVESKAQPERPITIHKMESKRKSIPAEVSNKGRKLTAKVPEPVKKENTPVSQENLPKISQMLNQTQRTNSSGGDSNDRISHGSSTINGMDKWLEWDFYEQSQLVQLYVSRQSFIQNQWMNAPPSPPPQDAPFFKNVTRR